MQNINNKFEFNNKDWLVRGDWINVEAACVFAQINIDGNVTFSAFGTHYIMHALARKYYEIIESWYIGFNKLVSAPPFWYINKAIKEYLLDMPDALLIEVSKYIARLLPVDRKKFLENYPYIAHTLNLSSHQDASNQILNQDSVESKKEKSRLSDEPKPPHSELSWEENAMNLYKELGLEKSHLSLEQKAEKVAKEMEKRHSAGIKGMTKRGGKKVPSASTIRRHALIKLL